MRVLSTRSRRAAQFVLALSVVWTFSTPPAVAVELLTAPAAAEPVPPELWSLHAQFTNVTQYHPDFSSPYKGQNSLDPGDRVKETIELTLFAGVRLWPGAAVYANPEVDQGFGLSETLG